MHWINSKLPEELQPRFFECAPCELWFISEQGTRRLTAESIACIMILPYFDGPRWLLRGPGGNPEADGVFVDGKVTAYEETDIKRGVFPQSLKVWGRPVGRFGRLLDSTRLFGGPGHDDTDEGLLQVNSHPHCGLPESSNTQAGLLA